MLIDWWTDWLHSTSNCDSNLASTIPRHTFASYKHAGLNGTFFHKSQSNPATSLMQSVTLLYRFALWGLGIQCHAPGYMRLLSVLSPQRKHELDPEVKNRKDCELEKKIPAAEAEAQPSYSKVLPVAWFGHGHLKGDLHAEVKHNLQSLPGCPEAGFNPWICTWDSSLVHATLESTAVDCAQCAMDRYWMKQVATFESGWHMWLQTTWTDVLW